MKGKSKKIFKEFKTFIERGNVIDLAVGVVIGSAFSKIVTSIVNDLLTLAKMENINSISTQKFDLSKEIQMTVAVFESMIYEKEIKLETCIDDGIYFCGEKEDIKHIISIILDNAIKLIWQGVKYRAGVVCLYHSLEVWQGLRLLML